MHFHPKRRWRTNRTPRPHARPHGHDTGESTETPKERNAR